MEVSLWHLRFWQRFIGRTDVGLRPSWWCKIIVYLRYLKCQARDGHEHGAAAHEQVHGAAAQHEHGHGHIGLLVGVLEVFFVFLIAATAISDLSSNDIVLSVYVSLRKLV